MSRWLKVVLVLALALSVVACNVSLTTIEGSGQVVTESRNVSGFDRVVFSGAGELIVTQGDSESLTITTDDNLMQYITTEVRDGVLEIGYRERGFAMLGRTAYLPRPTQSIVFDLQVRDLTGLTVSGAGNIEVDRLDTPALELKLSGAANVRFADLNADSLSIELSGAGNISLAGEVQNQQVRLSGVGAYQAADLASETASVNSSGLGNVTVWVSDSLDVTISGAGSVDYYGSPALSESVSGLGRIRGLGSR